MKTIGLFVIAVVCASGCAAERRYAPVERYGLFELRLPVERGYTTAAADETVPAEVPTYADVQTPSGALMNVEGYDENGGVSLRMSPQETGTYRFVVRRGRAEVVRGSFEAKPSKRRGPVRRDPSTPWRLIRDDGSTFYILGENRINIYDPAWNYGNASIPDYIARMAKSGMTTLRVFIFADTECEECADKVQLGALETALGSYDRVVAQRFDSVMNAAEANDVQVIITLFAIGFTEHDSWKSWDDNPYSRQRGGPAQSPTEFFTDARARVFAEKRLRYVLARWGYSSNLLAVDLLNEPEWDGVIPEPVWIPWAQQLARAAKAHDPYGRMVTAGPVGLSSNNGGGDERPWYDTPQNAMVQWHLYGEPFYNPQNLATEMTRRTREVWQHNRPVFCGEFGYGGEDQTTHEHTHVGLWSAVFSGGGALSHTAPPFNIDSDEPMTPERAHHFRVLRDFVDALPDLVYLAPRFDAEVNDKARVWELAADDGSAGAVWLLASDETPRSGEAHSIKLPQLTAGAYNVVWVDDVTGAVIGEQAVEATAVGLTLSTPPFTRHIAARFSRRE